MRCRAHVMSFRKTASACAAAAFTAYTAIGAATTNDLHSIVSYLASDELEGRLAGSRGAELAAEYIAAYMKRIGLQPVGTNENYFQSYEFNAGARVLTSANKLTV